MTNAQIATTAKADRYGNYYVSRHDRSGAVWYFRVSPQHLQAVTAEIDAVGGDIDDPIVKFVDAGQSCCAPGVAIDYDPADDLCRICSA